MATFRFLALPAELQTVIIEKLFRPQHLTEVCLVSKHLRNIALPLLYRKIAINVGSWSDDQIQRFLTLDRKTYECIRVMEIDSTDLEDEDKALKVAKDVLQVLPRDGLKSFRCPLEDGIDNDLVIFLAAHQRNLASICIGPLQDNAFNLIDALQPWPPTVANIVVPWKLISIRDVDFYRELIGRSCHRLKALTVRVSNSSWLGPDASSAQSSKELARGLFAHRTEGDYAGEPLVLRDINLQNQDLRAFDSTWRHYIDLSKLCNLQVWNCYRTDCMLQCLMDRAKESPLRLEGLVLSFERPQWSPSLAESFIGSISGLRYLNLCYMPATGKSSFDLHCLANHAHTIQDLYIGIGANERYRLQVGNIQPLWTPTLSEVGWLAKSCRSLRQLAIALPKVRMLDARAGHWHQYLRFLRALADLPRLKILRILTWPVDCEERHGKPRPIEMQPLNLKERRACFLGRLDAFADSIARLFSAHRDEHADRLSVITFGNAEQRDYAFPEDYWQLDMDGPITYKIRRVESEFGMLLETMRIDAPDMQYEEPIAFVFDEDTDQGLSLEAYPWGNIG